MQKILRFGVHSSFGPENKQSKSEVTILTPGRVVATSCHLTNVRGAPISARGHVFCLRKLRAGGCRVAPGRSSPGVFLAHFYFWHDVSILPTLQTNFEKTQIKKQEHQMRAIVLKGFGGPESLAIENLPDPEPKPGNAVIQVRAFGINHAETHMRKGEWAEAAPVSGIEWVGVIKECPGGE